MNKKNWRKHHKWFGLAMCFFMLVFCVSGLLLNHRSIISDVNVSRSWLPSRYEYSQWNGGLLRGTVRIKDDVLLYGNSGVWLTDSVGSHFTDFNKGLPEGADWRQIRNVVTEAHADTVTSSRALPLFAVSPFALYRFGVHGVWHKVDVPVAEGEKLTDVALRGDTLVVLSRSYVYVSFPPYDAFERVQLPAPAGYDGKATAFRTMWLLHSGELFGAAGKLVVDAIAVVLVLLCVTGLLCWLVPKCIKRFHRGAALFRSSFSIHDNVGKYTIVLTLFVSITGWCLRPPVMIALALSKVPALPGTVLRSDNAWNDKLRLVRYDDAAGSWLLSTSDGFFSISGFVPEEGENGGLSVASIDKVEAPFPVSVMGLNVMEKASDGQWLCGSFSGLFRWNRAEGTATDYFTGEEAPKKVGPPFGKRAISGLSQHYVRTDARTDGDVVRNGNIVVAEYYEGAPDFVPQPAEMRDLPMSLWNVALEMHTGRLFIGDVATYVFVFIVGLAAIWCLWSGYAIRRRKRVVKKKSS